MHNGDFDDVDMGAQTQIRIANCVERVRPIRIRWTMKWGTNERDEGEGEREAT